MEISGELNKKLNEKVTTILNGEYVSSKVFKEFLKGVNEDYENHELTMTTLEETMEKAFEDLYEANHKLRDDDKKHKVLLKKLKDSIKELQYNNENVFDQEFVNDEDLVAVAEVLKEQIRKRKEMEERQARLMKELEARNKELKEFAYIASHDLRSPLRAIGSLASWIKDDIYHKIDDTNQTNLDLLIARSKRLYDLIDAISRYSSLREDKNNLVLFDANLVLDEIIKEMPQNEHVEINADGKLPSILFRKKHFKEVLKNLIENVFTHNKGNKKVAIRIYSEEDEERWIFYVEDDGVGVDPKYHDKVFSLFQTLHPKDHIDTIGMGLPMTRKIIELYGGEISFIPRDGLGAILRFTILKKIQNN